MKSLTIAALAVSLAACTGTAATEEKAPTSAPSTTDSAPAIELVRIPARAGVDGFSLVVAPPTGDSVERWGLCLARVADCYIPGGDARTRERCLATTDLPPAAGENICPRSCRESFERAFATGGDAEDAVDASYKQGDCVSGFRELGNRALEKLKLDPRHGSTQLGETP